MFIKVYPHDETHRRELFGHIGAAIANPAIQEKLGGTIRSEPGDIWLIALSDQADREVKGFCRLLPATKAGVIKLRAFWGDDDATVEAALLARAVAEAASVGAKKLEAVERSSKVERFVGEGWRSVTAKGRQYIAFEREIGEGDTPPAATSDPDGLGAPGEPVAALAEGLVARSFPGLMDALRATLDAGTGDDIKLRVDRYNALVALAADHVNLPHPTLRPQLVPIETVRANDYNPNKVAPPEMRLLHISIAKDGLTMPIVVADEGAEDGKLVVVDGFHRTSIASKPGAIRESLAGYLPVVRLDKTIENRVAATVRHNIARGTHQVELSAKLMTLLTKHNWSNARIGLEIGMEPDEVLRLKQLTGLNEVFKDRQFSEAWEALNAESVGN